MGIESTSSAWKAEVIAVIRIPHEIDMVTQIIGLCVLIPCCHIVFRPHQIFENGADSRNLTQNTERVSLHRNSVRMTSTCIHHAFALDSTFEVFFKNSLYSVVKELSERNNFLSSTCSNYTSVGCSWQPFFLTFFRIASLCRFSCRDMY